jgi:hypothetical protein
MTKHSRTSSMKPVVQTVRVTRDSILKLLSEEELANVSNIEAGTRLPNGAEYLDLMRLDQGVQQAHGAAMDMSHLLPKSSLQEPTWAKILSQLAPAHVGR